AEVSKLLIGTRVAKRRVAAQRDLHAPAHREIHCVGGAGREPQQHQERARAGGLKKLTHARGGHVPALTGASASSATSNSKFSNARDTFPYIWTESRRLSSSPCCSHSFCAATSPSASRRRSSSTQSGSRGDTTLSEIVASAGWTSAAAVRASKWRRS